MKASDERREEGFHWLRGYGAGRLKNQGAFHAKKTFQESPPEIPDTRYGHPSCESGNVSARQKVEIRKDGFQETWPFAESPEVQIQGLQNCRKEARVFL